MENNDNEIIVGLDIGTTKVAAIVGREDLNGKIEILGFGRADSLGVKRGVVHNIGSTVEAIETAVAEAEKTSEVNISSVKVGIAGQHIKSHQHRGSIIRENSEAEITADEVNQLINSMYNIGMKPGEEIISVIPQEYTVDGEAGITHPVGMVGSSLEANFHIITGMTHAAKNIYKCITKAGLEVDELILEPLASSDAVLNDDELEAGVVLIDIGGGTTDIAIFHDKILRHTAVIPFGGSIVTDDVKEGCSIIRKHAEDLKLKFGSALANQNSDDEVVSIPGLRGRKPKEISLKNLASIIQARMQEIVEQVSYEIEASGYESQLIGGVVVTGGGAQLKHMRQLTAYVTGKDTRIGYPAEHLSSKVPEELKQPMYATSIGLVIDGVRDAKKRKEMEAEMPNQKKEQQEEPEKERRSTKISQKFLSNIIKFFDEEEKK
ncbi:MAG: cell division protein FtsA [Bacteroidales bacterium]|nr:cell division protein FtsA [Bacteroidales bacterium]MCF8333296.1 cell division protein FtsA [Bacteroidales bacterium]